MNVSNRSLIVLCLFFFVAPPIIFSTTPVANVTKNKGPCNFMIVIKDLFLNPGSNSYQFVRSVFQYSPSPAIVRSKDTFSN